MSRRVCWFVLLLAFSPRLAHAAEAESLREIRDIGTIQKAAQLGSSLENAVVHGLDFQQTPIIWQKIDVRGAVFLGCKFGSYDESVLVGRGALVFPGFRNLPYDPYRSALYTPAEIVRKPRRRERPQLGSADLRSFCQAGKMRSKRHGRPGATDSRPRH